MSTILVVDDDMALCRSLELQLQMDKHETVCACDVSSGLSELETSAPDLVLLDMNLPDENGLTALPRFLAGRSKPTVVLMTADTDNIVAVDAMRAGAFDYLRKPFVPINCSSVVPTLLESEFFGHEKGAFTGADKLKIGKFEFAEDGTVFLDEIGDMPFDLQGKLLRVLQEDEFVRVGGLHPLPLRARIIAATNRDLNALVKEGDFRKDLYYRLAVSPLHLPPLRGRREDIPLLAGELLQRIGRRLGLPVPVLNDEAGRLLLGYDWPGNVRELENVLTRAVALSSDTVLSGEYIAQCLQADGEVGRDERTRREENEEVPAGGATLAEMERKHIFRTLTETGWNITQAARILEISPTTLRKKIQDYDIKRT